MNTILERFMSKPAISKLLYRRQGKICWLNIRGFSAIEVFAEIFLHFLGHKYSLFSINKERHLYSRKNVHDTPENHEKHESLAQRIFPRLRYKYRILVSTCLVFIQYNVVYNHSQVSNILGNHQ